MSLTISLFASSGRVPASTSLLALAGLLSTHLYLSYRIVEPFSFRAAGHVWCWQRLHLELPFKPVTEIFMAQPDMADRAAKALFII